jgi:hypothetical protein
MGGGFFDLPAIAPFSWRWMSTATAVKLFGQCNGKADRIKTGWGEICRSAQGTFFGCCLATQILKARKFSLLQRFDFAQHAVAT